MKKLWTQIIPVSVLLFGFPLLSFAVPIFNVSVSPTTIALAPGGSFSAVVTIVNVSGANITGGMNYHANWHTSRLFTSAITSNRCPADGHLNNGQSCKFVVTLYAGNQSGSDRLAPEACILDRVCSSLPKGSETIVTVGSVPPPPPPPPAQLFSFTAVGYYVGSRNLPLSYFTEDAGKTWATSTILPPPQGSGNNTLYAAACDIIGKFCTSVGDYVNGVSVPLSYFSTDGGKTWHVSSTLPPAIGIENNFLFGVACDANGQICSTVGVYNSPFQPLSYYSTNGGRTWIVSSTLPPTQSGDFNQLNSVSCSSNGQMCAAVGFYTNVIDLGLSFFSTDGGQTWTVSSTLPPLTGVENNHLNGVACNGTGQNCTAVGFYSNGVNNVPLSYYSTDGGQTWTVSTTLPPPQGLQSVLLGVACGKTGQMCTAVGNYSSVTNDAPLSYFSTDGGRNWQLSSTLPPLQGTNYSYLSGVGCDETGLICNAVGYFDNGTVDAGVTYYSTDGGRNWVVASTLPPPVGSGNYLNGVAGGNSSFTTKLLQYWHGQHK